MATDFPTPEWSLETRRLLEAGLKADPDNARLLGILAFRLTGEVLNGWNDTGEAEVSRAEEAARKAISLDANLPFAHQALGWVHRLHGDHQAALDAFNEAIRIDPAYAPAYAQAGNQLLLLGDARGAITMAEKAIAIDPGNRSFQVFQWVKGRAHFVLGEYENAVEALQEAVQVRPNMWFSHAWLIAAFAHTNREAEATQRALERFRQHHGPRANLDWVAGYYGEGQYAHPTVQAALVQLLYGLERAGLRSANKVVA